MKKIFLFLLIIFSFNAVFCNDKIEISVLTCSPGNEIYSVFGHSALRVTDYEQETDIIFNFGMFDFGTPNFAFKFAGKTLYYCLGLQHPERFIAEYTRENRNVVEQKLDLSDEQKRTIVDRLVFLYQPENRYYLYAFLEKNCSTEIRDILNDVGVSFAVVPMETTSRMLLESYLGRTPWLRLGINMALGKPIDKKTDSYKSMFLPDYLHDGLENATIDGKPVVQSEVALNDVPGFSGQKGNFWTSPLFLFSILFFIVIFLKKRPVTITLFSLIGLVGIVVLGLMVLSGHTEVKGNLNLLWCNPLYLVYVPFLIMKKEYSIFPLFFLTTLLITIIVWVTGVQSFDISIVPLLLMLTLLNLRQIKITNS